MSRFNPGGGSGGGAGVDSVARAQLSDITSAKLSDYTYNLNGLRKSRGKKPFSAISIGDSIGAGTAAANNLGFLPQLNNAMRVQSNLINYDNIAFYYNNNVGTWTKEETGVCKYLLSSKTGSTNMQLFAQAWNIPQAAYTVQVVYSKRTDGGTFQVGYGSTPTILDTISCNGAAQDGVISATYTVPANQNCYLIPTDGQKAYINNAIVVRDATKSYYAYDNWSYGGRKAKDYTTAELTTMLTYLPKDLLIWEMLANDYSGNDYAAFVDRTESVMTTAQSLGMDILITITCGNSSSPSDPLWSSKWKAYLYDVAKRYNAAVIDYDAYFGGYTKAKANGLIADTIHPTDIGHLLMANVLIKVLLNVENPYQFGIQPCTTDSRFITYGSVQDNQTRYYPNVVAYDQPMIKYLDGNGNTMYGNFQPLITDRGANSTANFPKYAPKGTVAMIPDAVNPVIYENTTDWGTNKTTAATWVKVVAPPKLDVVTVLPTATGGMYGRKYLLTNPGVADDAEYICVKKADGTYVWKQNTLT